MCRVDAHNNFSSTFLLYVMFLFISWTVVSGQEQCADSCSNLYFPAHEHVVDVTSDEDEEDVADEGVVVVAVDWRRGGSLWTGMVNASVALLVIVGVLLLVTVIIVGGTEGVWKTKKR